MDDSRPASQSRRQPAKRGGSAAQRKPRPKSTRQQVEAEAEASGVAPLRYRQFRGMAWPPSAPPPSGTGTLPPSKLVLHHVHGYRGSDCRNNLLFTADGELLYFVAAVGIVHNFDTNTQRFFTTHDDDIVAIALHPDGCTVATGQVGRHATVCIWDCRSMRLVTRLQKVAERRVSCLSFSPDGQRLAVVGGDDHHTIKVLDWRRATTTVVTEARGHGNDVLALEYNPFAASGGVGGPQIVQCGAKHLKFWASAKGGALTTVTPSSTKTGPKAKLSQHFLCVAFFPDASAVVGAASGDILQFRGQELASVLSKAHVGFVSALRVLPDGGSLCSAGKDGKVIVWGGGTGGVATSVTPSLHSALSVGPDSLRCGACRLEAVVEMDLADVVPRSGSYGRAIAANDSGDVRHHVQPPHSCLAFSVFVLRLQVLAVGTSRNDIICFDRRDGTLNTIVVTQGHSAAVTGLALDPASPSFATAGDDKTLRCVEQTPGPQIATTSWPPRCGLQAVVLAALGGSLSVRTAGGGPCCCDLTARRRGGRRAQQRRAAGARPGQPTGDVRGQAARSRDHLGPRILAQRRCSCGREPRQQRVPARCARRLAAGRYAQGALLLCDACRLVRGRRIPAGENFLAFSLAIGGADVGVCQSTDGANELLYWDASGRRMPTATDFRDTEWDRWTCAPTTLLSHAAVLSFSLRSVERLGLSETGCVATAARSAGLWLGSGLRTPMAPTSTPSTALRR